MVYVGERTLEVVNLHNEGVPIVDIAKRLGLTPSSVESRLRSYRRHISKNSALPAATKWETNVIKEGFDRFIAENGRLPTADEVDDLDYLPSARQIQRRYGGLTKLREQLGYEDLHFGRGERRSEIQKNSRVRANEAELELYKWLVNRFGEPFVHSEKEYGDVRNRLDFLVYAEGITIGIDVFATNTLKTLRKNVDLKAKKYTRFPKHLPLLFVAWGGDFEQQDINRVCATHLRTLPNLRVVTMSVAYEKLLKVQPLSSPDGFRAMMQK